jgi:GAF domain-containing protein
MLSSSLDYEATLERLARLAVPLLADWCAIDMKEPDGNVRRLVAAHTDPAMEAKAKRIMDLYPASPRRPRHHDGPRHPPRRTLRTDPRSPPHGSIARPKFIWQMLRELGLRSMMIVPLVARERTTGVMTFVQAESGRRFTEADLAWRRTWPAARSLAVDNADLYRAAQSGQPHEDEFPRHRQPRAAYAAQRDPRLGPAPAQRAQPRKARSIAGWRQSSATRGRRRS